MTFMGKLLDDHPAVQSIGRKTMNEPKNKITLFDNREVASYGTMQPKNGGSRSLTLLPF